MYRRSIFSILFGLCCSVCQSHPVFKVIPLGVRGGNDESNLSAYALAVTGTNAYVCLDAGTLYYGIREAISAEQSNKLYTLWQAIGPLILAGRLKAIFIEVSFSNAQPDRLLFGRLTPRLLMNE